MNSKFLGAVQRSCNAKTARFGFLAFFLALIFSPLIASAAGAVPTIDNTLQGTGIPMVSLTVFLIGILRIFFGLLGIIALFLLIYGGFIWMSSQGDPEKVKKAKQIIYNTIIGLIVIFSAFAISSFLMSWLSGWGAGGGGGGTTNIPGGNGDWSRSAIGAGPIESVYPKPNAVNVPINTRIAVTFKENIKPESICNVAAGGTCNGEGMRNIEICEISATGTDCLPGSVYLATYYADSPVYQISATDKKTFVIYPKPYLGLDDGQNRTFKVLLKEEIIAEATNKSIFDGLRVNYYNWAFKTNGVLDFSPPEIIKTGLYPNPDNQEDVYNLGEQSTAGSANITPNFASLKFDAPAKINGVPYLGTTLTGIALTKESPSNNPAPIDSLKLNVAGAKINGLVNTIAFTVDSSQGGFVLFDAVPVNYSILGITYSTTGNCSGMTLSDRCLPVVNNEVILGDSGITIVKGTRDFSSSEVKGSKWSFIVSSAVTGDSFTFKNGAAETNFIFAGSDRAAEFTKATTVNGLPANISYTSIKSPNPASVLSSLADALNSKLGTLITASVSGNQVNIVPKAAGTNAMSFSSPSSALIIDSNLSGTERQVDRQALPLGSKPDPYNNSVFRVTFNKAINPINIDSYIKVNIAGQVVTASTTITNQYKTVELMGTKPCGVNSCGKMMYCWVDPNTNQNQSIPANITIKAAGLKACTGTNDSWCSSFGGSCAAGTVCQLSATGLNYPQASVPTNGLTDMSNNSFNGNFDKKAGADGALIGNANGPVSIYNANDPKHFKIWGSNNAPTFSYANDEDVNGDDFKWSFFLSTQIDRMAPLISKITPIGNSSFGSGATETFRDPVRLVFNGLMRMATLKPGWGYGTGKTDPAWNTRYILLKTMTAGANPVGYWINSLNLDEGDLVTGQGQGDGLADYSAADIEHNAYDQAVNYAPMGANGLESITQNCLLPGSGPKDAGAGICRYKDDGSGETTDCVTDLTVIPANRQVISTNPSSYSSMACNQIDGAVACDKNSTTKECKVHYATSTESLNGSWIIAKDLTADLATGKTGCCFGRCCDASGCSN